jgi:hypothetical protein
LLIGGIRYISTTNVNQILYLELFRLPFYLSSQACKKGWRYDTRQPQKSHDRYQLHRWTASRLTWRICQTPKETNNNEHKQSIHNRRYTLKDTLRREDNVVNNFVGYWTPGSESLTQCSRCPELAVS